MLGNITNDFNKIVTEDIPLIDVRAPIEFEKGAFLNSVNLPLMNDLERHLVGICYTEKGNEEAVKLGHQLVSGDIRRTRIEGWASFLEKHPDSMIYCFRGGQRSQISQQWIYEATGKEVTRLEGGYKAFRTYLINALEPSFLKSKPIVLGGYTGSGKTLLLQQVESAIDLESIACHRGSAFGQLIQPQPTQINFENNLAYAMIKHQNRGYSHMIFEDESRNIGKNYIPQPLYNHIKSGPLVVLDIPLEERVQIIVNEYVNLSQDRYIEQYGHDTGLSEWCHSLSESITRIKKRLGGELYPRILGSFEKAYENQLCTGSYDLHSNWVTPLLQEYYDPMYRYSLEVNAHRIIFKGDSNAVLMCLKSLSI